MWFMKPFWDGHMTTVDDPNFQAKKKKIWAILLIALAVLILCLASILLYFERLSPNARASLTAQAKDKTEAFALAFAITETESALPTLTLTSTSTEVPTHTPIPTATLYPTQDLQEPQQSTDETVNVDDNSATLTPTESPDKSSLPALTCQDIELQQENLTKLQWDRYVEEIIGRKITFSGKVVEVYQDQKVEIKDENCQNVFTVLNLFDIPEEDLASIQKDQTLRGEGTIRDVNFVYGSNIDINVEYYQK
jgi:hypothetical protein